MKLSEVTQPVEWRDIPHWPYQISSDGQVRNRRGQIIRPWKHRGDGGVIYHRVTLRDKSERWNPRVHRLVAQAFLPNPQNLPEVDHIDHNGLNNHLDNLRWVTKSKNVSRQRRFQPDPYQEAEDLYYK